MMKHQLQSWSSGFCIGSCQPLSKVGSLSMTHHTVIFWRNQIVTPDDLVSSCRNAPEPEVSQDLLLHFKHACDWLPPPLSPTIFSC